MNLVKKDHEQFAINFGKKFDNYAFISNALAKTEYINKIIKWK